MDVGHQFDLLAASLIAAATFALYVRTLAPTVLRSDSGEFHVVPWVLGIAHPPGYPLLTLLGRLTMLLPIGEPGYRINLLDAAAAAVAVSLVYLIVAELTRGQRAEEPNSPLPSALCPLVGGLAAAAALGLGATYWQQSVVGGPRPFVFFFTALLLWLLFRWGNRRRPRDLILLAGAAGLALAHHPNQVLLFPGLALYGLGHVRSGQKQHGIAERANGRAGGARRTYLLAGLAFVLPLLLYLYLPLRSAMNPPLGALGLIEPRELLLYVTAQHYQNDVLANCGGSRLVQLQRYLVFLSLQFGPLLSAAAGLGALVTLARAPLAGLTLLYAFLSNVGFGICSTLAMPDYIVPSYVVAASWLGVGLAGLLRGIGRWQRLRVAPSMLAAGVILGLGAYRLVTGLAYQDMGVRTTDVERARAGMTQAQSGSLVLSDWETATPIWYAQYVEGLGRRTRTALVTAPPTADTWLIEVEQALEDSRVSLAQRVPALDEKYRLFPIGSLYDVTEKLVVERSSNVGLLTDDRALRVLGYRLDRVAAAPGDLLHLTLYQRPERGHEVNHQPVLRLGSEPPIEFGFRGQLHHPSASWSEAEVVGEVYEFSVPTATPPGQLPLELAYRGEGRDGALVGLPGGRPWTRIGSLRIGAAPPSALTVSEGAVANFANQLVLRGGRVRGSDSASDLASEPGGLRLRPGGVLELEARWSALRWMDDSYTLFVHLLDGQGRLIAQQDALPLGGVYHTYKWVPGQVIADWYHLPLSPDLPAGEYWLEIGAYQSATTQRLILLDTDGSGERTSLLWGPIRIE